MLWKINAGERYVCLGLVLSLVFALTACSSVITYYKSTNTPIVNGNRAAETPLQSPTGTEPRVFVADQVSDGTRVIVQLVISNGPGWVVIYNQQNKGLGSVIGLAPVSSGVNYNVVVSIDPKQATTVLYALLHIDAGMVGKFEYPGPDTPVFVNAIMVSPSFKIIPNQPMLPAIASHDQDIAGGKVLVDRVDSIGPGWVVIRTVQPDGQPGQIIGYTSVNDGKNLGVTVTIDTKKSTPVLIAMLYVDAGEIGTFENPGPDIPAVINQQAVAQNFHAVNSEIVSISGNNTPVAPLTATPVATIIANPAVTAPPTTQLKITQAPTSLPGRTPTGQALAWNAQHIGGNLRVQVLWSGKDLDNFNTVLKTFEDQTGINVQVDSTTGSQVLNPGPGGPDVAGFANPYELDAYASQGILKPLDLVLDMAAVQEQYDPGFLTPARVNGQLFGIVVKANVKSLVWYDPTVFQARGFPEPKTWQDLQALEQQMAADNLRPWCIGVSGGPGSGWPGTDWVEDILLHQAGPAVYDQWVSHQISWTDDAVRQAWQTWGSIINNPKMVFGGPSVAVQSHFSHAFNPMFEPTPGCFLYKQGDLITGYFLQQFPNLRAGVDYNFFAFPSPNPKYQNTLEVSGDLLGMINDTPQARALIQYLASPDAQSAWATKGGYLAPNKAVNPSAYPNDLTRSLYRLITSASSVRFDGSDQMPPDVQNAFSTGVLIYPAHSNQLDAILSNIETMAQKDYPK